MPTVGKKQDREAHNEAKLEQIVALLREHFGRAGRERLHGMILLEAPVQDGFVGHVTDDYRRRNP